MKSKSSWVIIILGTLVMAVVMSITGKPLKTISTPHGIINLELASNAAKVKSILYSWNAEPKLYLEVAKSPLVQLSPDRSLPTLINSAKLNIWLDFIFIFFYTSLFYMLCKASVRWLFAHGHTTFAGTFLTKAVIFSALLDVIENSGMLLSLSGNISDTISAITMTASSIKWSIVAITILYLLTFAIYFGIFSKKKKIR